jgi:ComF family protein
MSADIAVLRWLRRAGTLTLDAVLPPRCLACSAAVDVAGALCAECWVRVAWLGAPHCDCCGTPFDFDPAAGGGERILCAACLRAPPEFDRARAVFRYDEASRGLILAFKHADRTYAAPAYGRWLARAGAELLAEADIVAPVPLHWTRLAWRRYNQAALLAQAASRVVDRRCLTDLLVRVRRTGQQQGDMGRAARRRNVRRAFAVRERYRAAVDGRRVVVIDDVYTTGATVEECTRVLRGAGARAVDVLTLARVVRPAVP